MMTGHFVAFLDILGFSQKVSEAKTPDENEKIKNQLLKIQKICKEYSTNNQLDGLNAKAFSDSVLISMPYGKDQGTALTKFLKAIIWLCFKLLCEEELLVRGGISGGYYYDSDGIVFGNALVKAVALEKKASVPCILIDEYLSIRAENMATSLSLTQYDGKPYIEKHLHLDYLKDVLKGSWGMALDEKNEHIFCIQRFFDERLDKYNDELIYVEDQLKKFLIGLKLTMLAKKQLTTISKSKKH